MVKASKCTITIDCRILNEDGTIWGYMLKILISANGNIIGSKVPLNKASTFSLAQAKLIKDVEAVKYEDKSISGVGSFKLRELNSIKLSSLQNLNITDEIHIQYTKNIDKLECKQVVLKRTIRGSIIDICLYENEPIKELRA